MSPTLSAVFLARGFRRQLLLRLWIEQITPHSFSSSTTDTLNYSQFHRVHSFLVKTSNNVQGSTQRWNPLVEEKKENHKYNSKLHSELPSAGLQSSRDTFAENPVSLFFPQITWASSSSVPKTEISKWQSMPGWRIGGTPMNSSSACHCYCCWSKAVRQRGLRATQQIRSVRNPFHQGSPGCHGKDSATSVLTDKQWNTVAAHHLLGKKGAIPCDQQKIVFTCFASLQEELTQLWPSRAWGSICWRICKGVHGEQRDNEHTRETDINPRCLLGHVKLIIPSKGFGFSHDQTEWNGYSAWHGSFAKYVTNPKICRLVVSYSGGLWACRQCHGEAQGLPHSPCVSLCIL